MSRRSFDKTNPFKEKRDSSKESQGTSDKQTSLDMIQETSRELEVKSFRDTAPRSDVGSSSRKSKGKMTQKDLLNKQKQIDVNIQNLASLSIREATDALKLAGQDKALQSDVRRSSDSSKNVEIPENFEHIGGNSAFAKAKVLLLGEVHVPQHHQNIVEFINTHAEKGDIVLVEGAKAGEKQDRIVEGLEKASHVGLLTEDDVKKTVEEKGIVSAYDEWSRQGLLFKEDIEIYGWDDKKAYDREGKLVPKFLEKGPSNQENSRLSGIEQEIRSLHVKREKSMVDTINKMRRLSPDKRLFIVTGRGHAENVAKGILGNQQYIVIIPKYKPTENDIEAMTKIKIESSKKS
jgi:hypothetical protein